MKYLSIDPSVNNIGWATYESPLSEPYNPVDGLWAWGEWNPPEGATLQERCAYICNKAKAKDPTHLVVEYPTFMVSLKGQIAAQKGYTIDLATVVGFVAGSLQLSPHAIFFYTPMQWKGQKKKHMIEVRFLSVFGREHKGTSDHAYEATMMLYKHLKNK